MPDQIDDIDIKRKLSYFTEFQSIFYLEYYKDGKKCGKYVGYRGYLTSKQLLVEGLLEPIPFSDIISIGLEATMYELAEAMNFQKSAVS